jgi:hypothetical protein
MEEQLCSPLDVVSRQFFVALPLFYHLFESIPCCSL